VLDLAGNLVNEIGYDAFGNILAETAAAWTGSHTFTGLLLDREADILWAKYRGLLPNGQWTGEDPIGFSAGDANLRRYVGNNAANRADLSGLEEKKLSGADLTDMLTKGLNKFDAEYAKLSTTQKQ
jgi:RHS repeat-associated protein